MQERLGEILSWLKLHFLVDYVTPELRKLLLEKLKKMLDKEWDGSPESVKSLKDKIGKKDYKSASGSVRNKIDKGDIENWDLTAVSHVLRSLNSEWVSEEEKERMEAAVQIRNHLSHHPSKVIPQEEFEENRQKLIGLLSFLNVHAAQIDEIEEKIKFRTSDSSSLFSPRVSNAEASKLIEGGSAAFRIADYVQAIDKFDNALKVASLKEAERAVLFCYRSAAFIHMAKEERYHERKDFAKHAKMDAIDAARLQPVWIEVHVHLGDAYKLLEKYEKAIKAYDEALSLDPCLEIVRTRRDDCRQELGQSRKWERMSDQQYIKIMDTLDTHPLSIDLMIEQITQNQKEKITKELQQEFLGCLKKSGNAFADVVEDTWYRFGIDVVVDFELAASYFSRAANERNARGIYVLARLTKKGLGVKKDYRRAFQLFNQAAQMPPILPNGLVNESVLAALHCTAMMYDEGVGVEISHCAASWYYKCAADLGFGPSAFNLAVMYKVRRGVPEIHTAKAVQYWKLAAQCKNARVMLALAEHYLNTLDVGQARKWFEFAVEAEEILATSTQKEFEAACKAQEEKTIWDIADVEKWEKENNLPSSNLSEEDRMERFLYFDTRWRSIALSPKFHPNFYKYDTNNYNVIEEYVSQGRVYAQQVLKAIGHYKLALSGLYIYEKSPNATIGDSIITETALCSQTAAYVFGFTAEGHQTLLMQIVKKKISEMKDQICEMDCYARICYAKLQTFSSEENVKFLEKCIDRYPEVPFFYEVLVATHNNLGLYHEGIKQAQKGLDFFPGNVGLMSDKALLTKNVLCSGNLKEHADMKDVIDCYVVFLKHAPADHRFVPEVYYSMAQIILQESLKKNIRPIDGAVRTYYEKGLESEKQLLPCFLPYEELSETKRLISAYFKMTAKDVEEKMSFSLKSVCSPMSKLDRLTDPVRVLTIRHHRQLRFASRAWDKVTVAVTPYVQCAPSCASNDLQSITISEMNPMVDKVYEGHKIDVTIIDDPAAPLAFYVVCVVEDTRGDVMRGLFYNVEGDRRIKFGAKVSILQPYLNINPVDQRPGIRVDDPKSLIFHEEDPISVRRCRYCDEKNAKFSCKRCKTDYCSKECQTKDWKILKHKLICIKKSTPRPIIAMTM